MDATTPMLQPLGDAALLIRFARRLEDAANRQAVAVARRLEQRSLPGVIEVVPSLVSVLVRYNPRKTGFEALAGEVRLALSQPDGQETAKAQNTVHEVPVTFGGSVGPDLQEVAAALDMETDAFVEAHNRSPLRVMAVGFAPGFVYCGMHAPQLHLPRRHDVRPLVPAGAVLFAAGQTAIAATPIPTGWHVIGQTDLRNFDADRVPAVLLQPGDGVVFRAAT